MPTAKEANGMKEFKVVPIRNGTVLDHVESGKALEILQALGYPVKGSSKVVSLSMHLPSSRGNKDVLKFEDVELSPADVKKVKAITKTGTLSVIRNYDIAEKQRWGQ
jgi:aspartate carbamoyltransferase regulatory subunit